MIPRPAGYFHLADGVGRFATPRIQLLVMQTLSPRERDAADKMEEIERRLDAAYGPRHWQSSGSPLDELIATVLSQNTSDVNTERAFASLRRRFRTWEEVRQAPTTAVADAIRCGGLAEIKAPRIQRILDAVHAERGALNLDDLGQMPLAEARRWLLALDGVGPKTAACVLLFSLGRPALPVDTHVHRVALRLGLIPPKASAEAAHELLQDLLGDDRDRVYAFHVEAIAHGRQVCTARRPRCERCPLTDCCDYFRAQFRAAGDPSARPAPGRG
jgi:endonuclease-3